MFKHILVPTDLTERDQKTIEIAIKMAQENSAVVTLLHVIETIDDTDSEDFQKFYKQLGVKAGKKMDKIISEYRKGAIPIEKKILYGKRVNEILGFADSNQIDLIILSSHKLDLENASEGWGTISFKVGVLSHCPVMLVK
jgi:nucleotide-binding universal stress UspA family protein